MLQILNVPFRRIVLTLRFWADMFEETEGWHFLGSERVQVMKIWRRTMRAFAILWDDLQKDGHESLPVGAMNQDCRKILTAV